MRRLLLLSFLSFHVCSALPSYDGCEAPCQGPPGPSGETGPIGERGAQGLPGQSGRNGQNGQNGPAGPQGAQGCQGLRGFQGAMGPDGQTGPRGMMGPVGPTGPTGMTGPTGICNCPAFGARYILAGDFIALTNTVIPFGPNNPVESFPAGVWAAPTANNFVRIPQKGIYEITWIINLAYFTDNNISIGISTNGTTATVINTQAGVTTDSILSTGYLVGTAILPLNAGALVGAVNIGDDAEGIALLGVNVVSSSYSLLLVRRGSF